MSDYKPTGDDPTPADVAREEPPLVEPTSSVEPVETPPSYQTAPVEPLPAPAPAPAEPARDPFPAASPANREIVYVAAPVPPKVRNNRVAGVLLAVLGAVLFAVLYAGAYALATAVVGIPVATAFTAFASSYLFWVPVLVFLVTFVLLVLALNRAGWWAHVLGSLIVALVVYFASAGILLLVSTIPLFAPDVEPRAYTYFLALPALVIAGVVAREVSIWIGLAIAARGRRLTSKNRESRAEFEREQAEKRAEYERSSSTS